MKYYFSLRQSRQIPYSFKSGYDKGSETKNSGLLVSTTLVIVLTLAWYFGRRHWRTRRHIYHTLDLNMANNADEDDDDDPCEDDWLVRRAKKEGITLWTWQWWPLWRRLVGKKSQEGRHHALNATMTTPLKTTVLVVFMFSRVGDYHRPSVLVSGTWPDFNVDSSVSQSVLVSSSLT